MRNRKERWNVRRFGFLIAGAALPSLAVFILYDEVNHPIRTAVGVIFAVTAANAIGFFEGLWEAQ